MADDHPRITASTPDDFRRWLDEHADTAAAVWLVYYKQGSGVPSITWPEAVDEALCHGWIDSKIVSIDDARYEQYFTRRKPTSPWSRVNKEKVERLLAENRIQPAGLAAIETAKENGSWSLLDSAEARVIPDDLADAFPDDTAVDAFRSLSPSRQRNILQWIALARRPDTRQRRIEATADAAARGVAPANF